MGWAFANAVFAAVNGSLVFHGDHPVLALCVALLNAAACGANIAFACVERELR
jgi:hypothetical protein